MPTPFRRMFAAVKRVLLLGVLLLAAAGAGVGVVRAHDPGISTATLTVRGDALAMETGFAPADAQHFLPAALRAEEKWTEAEFETVRGFLTAMAPQLWEVRMGETVVPPRGFRVQLLPGDNVNFQLTYPRPPGAGGTLTLRAPKLPELPSGHRQFLIVADERGSTITKKLLSARDFTLEAVLPVEGPAGGAGAVAGGAEAGGGETVPTALGFVKLGVEHIWTGYDHLLFLFALLVVCRTFRSIVAIITCFTLAHSLTLAVATLDVVNVSARFVEPAIAASIVFVGAENLWRRGEEPPGRWVLTFVFGLIHGFGFASVLRDLGVGRGGDGILMPLFTFNLGVELGQIVVAAVVLPIVWQLRKNERFVRVGVPAVSAVVAALGLYWVLARTVWA